MLYFKINIVYKVPPGGAKPLVSHGLMACEDVSRIDEVKSEYIKLRVSTLVEVAVLNTKVSEYDKECQNHTLQTTPRHHEEETLTAIWQQEDN